jgi:hypothetical protein
LQGPERAVSQQSVNLQKSMEIPPANSDENPQIPPLCLYQIGSLAVKENMKIDSRRSIPDTRQDLESSIRNPDTLDMRAIGR